ncbi:MAG: hypothetical protein RL177_42 [Bacteroidota bacterium]|jgi:flagellar biosynthesis protein FliQ
MIQRPQTLVLALSVVLNGYAPFNPIADRLYSDPHGWWAYAFLSAILLSALTAAYAISLFKDRPSQARWILRSVLFQAIAAGLSVAILTTIGPLSEAILPELISGFIVVLTLILLWVSRSLVLKDEALVKSIDRIR